MPRLFTYVDNKLAERLKRNAESEGISTSQAIARLIDEKYGGDWPEDFRARFFGAWKGEPLVRPEQGVAEERDSFA